MMPRVPDTRPVNGVFAQPVAAAGGGLAIHRGMAAGVFRRLQNSRKSTAKTGVFCPETRAIRDIGVWARAAVDKPIHMPTGSNGDRTGGAA